MTDYRAVIQDKSGSAQAELTAAENIEMEWVLNRPGSASFELPLEGSGIEPGDISLGFTELLIYRGEVLVWAGEIQTDTANSDTRSVTFGAKGWLSLLDRRETGTNLSPTVFTAVDPADIIEALLTENAELGITMGAKALSRPRDRRYEFKNVKKAIEGLSAANIIDGIDFEITPDKVFNTYYPKGQTLDTVSFETGRNIISWSKTGDATALANEVTMLGAGQGVSMLTSTSTGPTYLIDSYKKRQQSLAAKDVSIQETLDDHAQAERRNRQIPQQLISITTDTSVSPGWGGYSIGDTVPVRIDEGLVQINGLYRIYGIRLKRSSLGKELVTLTFNPS